MEDVIKRSRLKRFCPNCAFFNIPACECKVNRSINSHMDCFDYRIRTNGYTPRLELQCLTCTYNHQGLNVFCHAGLNRYVYDQCPTYNQKQKENEMEASRYYVFNPKAGAPKVPHAAIDLAIKEAERIAEMEQNTEILVLRAVVGITHPSKQFIYRNFKK